VASRSKTPLRNTPLRAVSIVSPLPQAIKFCHEFLGPEHLLFASDHPWVDPALIRECLAQAGLLAVDHEKILGENARQLFDRFERLG
jgi:predicted TIM-barrel fold metal-dependent hydrolase